MGLLVVLLTAAACLVEPRFEPSLVRDAAGVTASVSGWTATRTVGFICPLHPGERVTLSDEWRQHLRDMGCFDFGLHDGPLPSERGWRVTFYPTRAERMVPFAGRQTYFIVLLSPEGTFVAPVQAVNLLMPEVMD